MAHYKGCRYHLTEFHLNCPDCYEWGQIQKAEEKRWKDASDAACAYDPYNHHGRYMLHQR